MHHLLPCFNIYHIHHLLLYEVWSFRGLQISSYIFTCIWLCDQLAINRRLSRILLNLLSLFPSNCLLHLNIFIGGGCSLIISYTIITFVFFTRNNVIRKFFPILFRLIWLFAILLFFRDGERLNYNILVLLLNKSGAFITLRKMVKNIITLLLICGTLLSETHNCIWSSINCVITTHGIATCNLML